VVEPVTVDFFFSLAGGSILYVINQLLKVAHRMISGNVLVRRHLCRHDGRLLDRRSRHRRGRFSHVGAVRRHQPREHGVSGPRRQSVFGAARRETDLQLEVASASFTTVNVTRPTDCKVKVASPAFENPRT
jgi:hypothetical protein